LHLELPLLRIVFIGFYPTLWYIVFQKLVRFQGPYAEGFKPEDCRDDGSESEDEQVFAREPLHQHEYVEKIEAGGEDSVEEVPRKQEPAQLDKMSKHSNLYFAG